MAVFGVANRKVGTVKLVNERCFEVARLARDGGPLCLTLDSVFTVDERDGVTLMCMKDEVERYRCPEHSPRAGDISG